MIMITSVVIVATLGVVNVGGFGEVWNRAVDGGRISSPEYCYISTKTLFLFILSNRIISIHNSFTLDLVTRTTFWNTTSGVFCIWLCHIGFSQSCVQRLVSLPSLRAAKRSMIIFFLGVVFIMTFNCGTGIIMYAYYYDCDPVKEKIVTKYDKLMPRFVEDVSGYITGMSGEFHKQIINKQFVF